MDNDTYLATQSGAAIIDGEPYVFEKGITRVRAGHPLLKQLPDFFAPADDEVTYELPAKPAKQSTQSKQSKQSKAPKAKAGSAKRSSKKSDGDAADAAPAETKLPDPGEQDASLGAGGGLTSASLSAG